FKSISLIKVFQLLRIRDFEVVWVYIMNDQNNNGEHL
ncbi:MAG: hypothetical protein ACI808_002657, partial [Paraglaciecola sp.]